MHQGILGIFYTKTWEFSRLLISKYVFFLTYKVDFPAIEHLTSLVYNSRKMKKSSVAIDRRVRRTITMDGCLGDIHVQLEYSKSLWQRMGNGVPTHFAKLFRIFVSKFFLGQFFHACKKGQFQISQSY